MTSEESEPSASQPLEASATPLVEDPKNQEDNSSLKENVHVSEILQPQTLHEEIEEMAKEVQGEHIDVIEMGTEVGSNNEAKLEAEAGVADRGEVELQTSEGGANNEAKLEAEAELQSSERKAEVGNGHHAEIKAEAEAGAELDSQADDDSEVPAESESGADVVGTAEADGDEEEEKPRKLTVDDIKTAPMDFRFPTTNQAKHCFTRYVEYHKCVQAKGDDSSDCNKYARYYRSLCPGEWVDRWNEQRENGTFPGPL